MKKPTGTLNGPWSAILHGAYKKIQKVSMPYKCTKCHKSFRNAGNLANHVVTHKRRAAPSNQPKISFPAARVPLHLTSVEVQPSSAPVSSGLTPLVKKIRIPRNKLTRQRRTRWKIWSLMQGYEEQPTPELKQAYCENNGFTYNNYKTWNRSRAEIEREATSRSTCYNRLSLNHIRAKSAAKYPVQEAELHKKYKARRAEGMVVDYEWLKSEMKILLQESSLDPQNSFSATNHWVGNFMKRKGLSVQKKTNRKHRSIQELLPRVKNFHWHSIYHMALLDP